MVLLRERMARRGSGAIEVSLPSPAKRPPSGPGWIHEIKHDGFRLIARRDGEAVRLLSRKGIDLSRRFPFIAWQSPSCRRARASSTAGLSFATNPAWRCSK